MATPKELIDKYSVEKVKKALANRYDGGGGLRRKREKLYQRVKEGIEKSAEQESSMNRPLPLRGEKPLNPLGYDVMSYMPVIGDAIQASEAADALGSGNYAEAALLGGLLLVPNAIEKGIKRVGKKFISELDWSPESWFGKRVSKKWTKEDEEELAKHIAEYHEIERAAKENGTWLKNADGSKYRGDPRAWVMERSKAAENLEPETWYSGILGNDVGLVQADFKDAEDYVKKAIDYDYPTAFNFFEGEALYLNDIGATEAEKDKAFEGLKDRLRKEYEALPKDKEEILSQLAEQRETWTGPVWGTDNKQVANGFGTVSQMEFRIPKQESLPVFDIEGNGWNDIPYMYDRNTGTFIHTKGKDYFERVAEKNDAAGSKNERRYYVLRDTNELVNMWGSEGSSSGGGRRRPDMPYHPYTKLTNIVEGRAAADDAGNILFGKDGPLFPVVNDIVIAPGNPRVFVLGNNGALTGVGNPYKASGGSIHIKPSHRGRLTELKERTGKTEAELYNDGNPAHKKMVVFARNARGWKHADGGYLGNYLQDFPVNTEVRVPYDADYLQQKAMDRNEYRRRMKQRYVESGYNDKAKSGAGAVGAYQIMPITKKDYITRGKGKEGDLLNPSYNEAVRNYALDSISRDLGNLWSDEADELNKLAMRYAGYNLGAGNLKKYLRKKQSEGVDIHHSLDWMNDLPKETKDYVDFIVLDKDVPGTSKTMDEYRKAWSKFSKDLFPEDEPVVEQKPSWTFDKGGFLNKMKAAYSNDQAKMLGAVRNALAKKQK